MRFLALAVLLAACTDHGNGITPGAPSIDDTGGRQGDFVGVKTTPTSPSIGGGAARSPDVNGGIAAGPILPGAGAFTLGLECRQLLTSFRILTPTCSDPPNVTPLTEEGQAMPACAAPDASIAAAILGCWGAACAGASNDPDDANVDEANALQQLADEGELCACPVAPCLSETYRPCPVCP